MSVDLLCMIYDSDFGTWRCTLLVDEVCVVVSLMHDIHYGGDVEKLD